MHGALRMCATPANVSGPFYLILPFHYLMYDFVGYCFKSAEDIHSFAEDRAMGKTVQWAAKQGMQSGSRDCQYYQFSQANWPECGSELHYILRYTERFAN
jgi:hypothetical protein